MPLGMKTFILILLSVATFYKARELFYVWKGDKEKELQNIK
jgi:hypothetical protein